MINLIKETNDIAEYEFTNGTSVRIITIEKQQEKSEDGEVVKYNVDAKEIADQEYERWISWLGQV
jgi:hypothetical protein